MKVYREIMKQLIIMTIHQHFLLNYSMNCYDYFITIKIIQVLYEKIPHFQQEIRMKRIGPPKKWTRHRIYDVLFQSSVKALHVSYFLLTGLFIVQVVGYVKGKPIEILSTNTNPPHQVFWGSEFI